ncbi:MAG: hypothetical protein ACJ8GN_21525 [Longimicrobiaceae bacterium]
MSESAQLVAIIVAAIVAIAIVLAYRKNAKRIHLGVNKHGASAEVETHQQASSTSTRPGGVRISDSSQTGKDHTITVSRADVDIERFRQKGERQTLQVTEDSINNPEEQQ